MGTTISFGKISADNERQYIIEKLSAFFGIAGAAEQNAENFPVLDSIQEKGLSVFIFGANMPFSVLNEGAGIQAESQNIGIKTTAYYRTYKDLLEVYKAHVDTVSKNALSKRLSQVSGIKESMDCTGAGIVVCTYTYYFTDYFLNETFSHVDGYDNKNKDDKAKEKTEKDRVDHINSLKAEVA